MTQGGWNLKESIFANPFTVKKYGIDECLRLYEEHLRELIKDDPKLWKKTILGLSGKTIGCWCHNRPENLCKDKGEAKCHGDVIVKIFLELAGQCSY